MSAGWDSPRRLRRCTRCSNGVRACTGVSAGFSARITGLLEQKLAEHANLNATAKWAAKWAAKLRVSRRFGRYLAVTKGGKLRIDRAAIKQAARYDGRWVLITNDDSLSVEDAAASYRSLLVIERCFRSLKTTQIQMRPMYHWLARRIEAHVKVCVLSLLLAHVAERACGRPWPRLRYELDTLQATTLETETHRIIHASRPNEEVLAVLGTLDIEPPKPVLGATVAPGPELSG